jgi:hypothetical protein
MSQLLLPALIVVAFGAVLRLRLPRCFHRDAQELARRNDQAQRRPLQLADRQMGMGGAAERITILNAWPQLFAALFRQLLQVRQLSHHLLNRAPSLISIKLRAPRVG